MTTSATRGIEPTQIGSYDRRTASRAAAAPARTDVRERWRMGGEARGVVLVTAVLLAFGLATLYSASAIVAMQAKHASYFYFVKQVTGALAGMVVFAVMAKVDAERWRRWAWPLMGLAVLLMLVTVL